MPKRSMPEVMDDIANVLKNADRPISTREVAKREGLDQNTVKKYLDNIQKITKHGSLKKLSKPQLDLWSLERPSLLSLSEEKQTDIVRKHFPEPSKTDKALARLFLAGAVDESRPLDLELPSDLLEDGFVEETKDGYYLTEEGRRVARGALKTYPELKTD